jgi:two-component system, OmpR family, response regulator ResD
MTTPIRVLIADPDEILLSDYRNYLERHSFQVTTATTGLTCVAAMRHCTPDVLVLEPSIPWGGGDGVLAMMHEESSIPSVPVIVLTYGRDRSILYRLAPYKIDDYHVKPMRPNRLAERILAVARRRQFEIGAIENRPFAITQEIATQQLVGRMP